MIILTKDVEDELNNVIPKYFLEEINQFFGLFQSIKLLLNIELGHSKDDDLCYIFKIESFNYDLRYYSAGFSFLYDIKNNLYKFRFLVNSYNEIFIREVEIVRIRDAKDELENITLEIFKTYIEKLPKYGENDLFKFRAPKSRDKNTILKMITHKTNYFDLFNYIENILMQNNFYLLVDTYATQTEETIKFCTIEYKNQLKSNMFFLQIETNDTFFKKQDNVIDDLEFIKLSIIKNEEEIKNIEFRLEEITKNDMNNILSFIQQFIMRYNLERDE